MTDLRTLAISTLTASVLFAVSASAREYAQYVRHDLGGGNESTTCYLHGAFEELPYRMLAGLRVPDHIDTRKLTLRAVDPCGEELVIDGTPVVFEQVCDSSTGDSCEPHISHPGRSDEKWIEFHTVYDVTSSGTSPEIAYFTLIYELPPAEQAELEGSETACWISDDRDVRYGYDVFDVFATGVFSSKPGK